MLWADLLQKLRQKTGLNYRPNTLYEIVVSIQHHFRHNGRFINILDDAEFGKLRQILDAKMKEIAKTGLGSMKKQAQIITEKEENEMWEKGVLGTDTGVKLLDTIVYHFELHFALRAGQEHRNLRFGQASQISLKTSHDGKRYLEYVEDISKTNNGGLNSRKIDPKVTRAYGDLVNPDRCIVLMYEKYAKLRPKKYPTSTQWYDDVPVGVHSLQKTVGKLCDLCGFEGFYSNHSLRATAATRLYSAGVDEQLISEKTGHRSLALRGYKRTSDEQLEMIDSIVKSKNVKYSDVSAAGDSREETQIQDVKHTRGEIKVQASRDSVSITIKF
ncbi:hypothetical protein FSP39_016881 [Pinctada imbricata]|uniref:Tyr recombinase domain-containing protein n=1 Tax=Pinctada imbricata TaxID=66713 RepID=A0AA88XG13_PINIB|nr:hypothetical protein FSP39_016881 [Pinctada imbricata]